MNTRSIMNTRKSGDALNTLPPLTGRRAASLFGDDSGAATAEYAITTMATVGVQRH